MLNLVAASPLGAKLSEIVPSYRSAAALPLRCCDFVRGLLTRSR
jgi:hypothetical protein